MSYFNISLVIPTFKREDQILKIVDEIQKQIKKNIKVEILICDSYSNYNKKKLKINKKNFKVKYLNISNNNLSAKRNYGIKKTNYENIVLIDDDCIPKKNFLKNYINEFKKIDNRTILSGIVSYPIKYILKFNHIRHKNYKHFKNDKHILKELFPDKVVAMNMAFKKTRAISSLGFFDERFKGYGFEDHEFAHRYSKKGFKLLRTRATIIHDEGKPNINKYSQKYYHLARDGMKNLLNVNKSLAKSSIYYQIENNFFILALSNIPHISSVLKALEKIIIKTDKIPNFKLLFLYDYLRLFSYVRGYIDRKKNKIKSKKNIWYESNF